MSISPRDPSPVSTRRAIALAFDLALRRDPMQSLVVPLLLRAPWILTLGLLGPADETESPGRLVLLASGALIGDYLALTITSAMLRFRALSVFDAPAGARPAPALECYARALARVPWLMVTEFVRYMAAFFGLFFLIVPGVVLGFRLSVAAEAVTLHEPHLSAAFSRSFRLSARRFERWLELSVASALPVMAVWFVIAGRSIFGSEPVPSWWFTAAWMLFAAWTPIVLYAWAFFYLRLREVDSPGVEVGPAYAATTAPAAGAALAGPGLPPAAGAEPGAIAPASTAAAYAPMAGELTDASLWAAAEPERPADSDEARSPEVATGVPAPPDPAASV